MYCYELCVLEIDLVTYRIGRDFAARIHVHRACTPGHAREKTGFVVLKTIRVLYRHVVHVCNVSVSCKANGDRNGWTLTQKSIVICVNTKQNRIILASLCS